MKKLPDSVIACQKSSAALDGYLDAHSDVEDRLHQAIEVASKEQPLSDDEVLRVAKVIGDVVGRESYEVVKGGAVQCEIRCELLSAWRRFAKHPDKELELWLREGGLLV